jgi:histidinol-phosphate phosphatase family protein
MSLKSLNFNSGWSLFLDRDGVINHRIPDNYVKTVADFAFINGVPEALAYFNKIFTHIFIVTNQQGIGKGLMQVSDLDEIHRFMLSKITGLNGRIDKVYHCPDLKESGSFYRKPGIGMGLQARKDFPDLRFRNCLMVGDSESDLRFGKRLGMKTVFISDNLNEIRTLHKLIDYSFPALLDFAKFLQR